MPTARPTRLRGERSSAPDLRPPPRGQRQRRRRHLDAFPFGLVRVLPKALRTGPPVNPANSPSSRSGAKPPPRSCLRAMAPRPLASPSPSKATPRRRPKTTAYRDLAPMRDSHVRPNLDLVLPEKSAAPLPLVIWVHGGRWQTGRQDPGLPLRPRPGRLRFLRPDRRAEVRPVPGRSRPRPRGLA